jgi:hypothetical protein
MDTTKLPNYSAAVARYTEAVANEADEKEQKELYANALNVLGTELMENLDDRNAENVNTLLAQSQNTDGVSASVKQFLNEIAAPETDNLGTKKEVVLPLEIINQVFDELTYGHPLLDIIKFQSAGLKMKAVVSKSIYDGGTAHWGKFTEEIKGQLNQSFDEVDFSQSKLTAYVVLPKDALSFGYAWLKNYVVTQISEAMAVALETAFVIGNGVNQPVGLMKDESIVNGATTYADKEDSADLSDLTTETAAKKLAPLMKKLSVNAKGISVNISGQVKLLVNPNDYYEFVEKFLYLNSNGVWIDIMPFNIQVVQSMAVPQGKAVLFAANRYWAYMGGMSMQEYDQTFALEDLQLYVNKSFYYGKPFDNNASLVVSIAVPVETPPAENPGA